ncbi:hypothetical protein [uncultured Imperialibacter sp.]|uniref:hypothetical protein n=1 Tax=uncultured Imperialibacter sp. TaxID=1672639 RepID=UPI0030D8FC1C
MKKVGLLLIFGIVAGLIGYLSFEELLYSEYWLQRKINAYSCIEPLLDVQKGTAQLKYKFLKDDEIDLEVSINDAGYVFLSTGTWYADSPATKSFNFRTDPEITRKIIDDFRSRYSEAELNSYDDHLNACYYTLEFTDLLADAELSVGFYNYMPSAEFLKLTSELVTLGNDVMEDF